MKCPRCDGGGQTFAFVNMGDEAGYVGPVNCMVCKGTGLITDEHMSRIIAGRAAREARQARGETLMQAARRKGVSALEISRFERGENELLLSIG